MSMICTTGEYHRELTPVVEREGLDREKFSLMLRAKDSNLLQVAGMTVAELLALREAITVALRSAIKSANQTPGVLAEPQSI